MKTERVCVGQIGAPHGVRGLVIVRSFTEISEDIAAYGALTTEDGIELSLELKGAKKSGLIAAIAGIGSREAADLLKGARLYVERSRLPETEEGEYYHADLIGIKARDSEGRELGRVVAVHDFGAGELIEIDPGTGKTVLIPFTKESVPLVDIAGAHMIVEHAPDGFPDAPVETP